MCEEQPETCPWRDGNYRGEAFIEAMLLSGTKALVANNSQEVTFHYGVFGEVDEEIAEMTGEKNYTVEMTFDMLGKVSINLGVIVEEGTKFVIRAHGLIMTLDWVTEEEAERLANDGDPIEAPTSPYKVEPDRQGRLVWLAGPPGLGKSTSAQLLSREHGYVYYEGDCFLGLKNPYIPPSVEGAGMAHLKQRKLVGKGAAERRKSVDGTMKQWEVRIGGGEWEAAAMQEGYKEMFEDIARERARLGGDWAVACLLDSRAIRDLAR